MKILVAAAFLLSPLYLLSNAYAVCSESPANTFTCDTAQPNPDLDGILQLGNNNNLTVTMLPGSAILAADDAITLGDGNNVVNLNMADVVTDFNGITVGSGVNQVNIIDSELQCFDNCVNVFGDPGSVSAVVVHNSLLHSLESDVISGTNGNDSVEVVNSQVLASDVCCYKQGIQTQAGQDNVIVENSLVSGYRNQPPNLPEAIHLGADEDNLYLRNGAELIGIIHCGDDDDTITFEMDVPQNQLAALQAELAGKADDDSITINGRLYQWLSCETLVDKLNGVNPADTRSTFRVTKIFSDENTALEATVKLSCNSGLILDQQKKLKHGETVEFVLTSAGFNPVQCSVTEDFNPGYVAVYNNGIEDSAVSCAFDSVDPNDQGECTITNDLNPVEVLVHKKWIYEGTGGDQVSDSFEATLYCAKGPGNSGSPGSSGYIIGGQDAGSGWKRTIQGSGDAEFSFQVYPYWNGGTNCHVEEHADDSSVESDSSDCDDLHIAVNTGDECTVHNTVFFEGVPTLGEYGQLMLALLLLGVGVNVIRRLQ